MAEEKHAVNPHLRAILCRRRGQHEKLAFELGKLPAEQQLELFRLIQDLEMEVDSERRKRKQGRMF